MSVNAQDTNAFDYIVVGAGAAGCVIANRLSADSATSVLLLEAGGSDAFFTNTRFLDLASLFSLWSPETDWGYSTEPSPGMNGRSIAITQGKVLGGGSSTNGRIFLRGNRRDYDSWNQLGNEGWAYNDLLPYFKKYENYSGGENAYHGAGGPVSVIELPAPTPVSQAFMQAAIDHGFAGPADVNGEQQENAVGYCQSTTTRDLERASTAVAYIHPIMERKNFTLKTNVQATRVLFEGNRAVGVEYLEDGATRNARATSEVIVCGGGFNTPKLLQLSGIGPADHLRSHGIPVVADLPGVGENLQDHLLVRMSWHLKEKQPDLIILSEVNLFTYSRPGLGGASPDLQYMFAPFFFPEYGPLDAGITLVPVISRPQSTGTVRLRSGNPLDAPRISPNYLSSDTDVQVLLSGIELGYDLMRSHHLDPFRGDEVVPGPDGQSTEKLTEYIRNTAVTVWHPSCSCRMGHDEMSVVDPQLHVHGITGLRVADCSVMPKIVNANLQATVIMIGEKAADMILSGH
jgi:choline dehydrogenase